MRSFLTSRQVQAIHRLQSSAHITAQTIAIWRRIRSYLYGHHPDQEQDKDLRRSCGLNSPAFSAGPCKAVRDWRKDGLGIPEEIQTATANYKRDMDTLAAF